MKVKTIEQTCYACPSQWEIKLEDGRMVYVRYRWGYLSARLSPNKTDDIMDAVSGKEIFGKTIGDKLDGYISESRLRTLLKDILEW